jgi:hypothetical protein
LRTKNTTIAKIPRPRTATAIPTAAPGIGVFDPALVSLAALFPADGLADAAEEEDDKCAVTVTSGTVLTGTVLTGTVDTAGVTDATDGGVVEGVSNRGEVVTRAGVIEGLVIGEVTTGIFESFGVGSTGSTTEGVSADGAVTTTGLTSTPWPEDPAFWGVGSSGIPMISTRRSNAEPESLFRW